MSTSSAFLKKIADVKMDRTITAREIAYPTTYPEVVVEQFEGDFEVTNPKGSFQKEKLCFPGFSHMLPY